jgi:hypothetical protein
VLRGARGLILWDENNSIVRPDASPGPRAAAYSAVFAALHGPIGRRLVNAVPLHDPVAILYSPASFRLTWLLEHRHDGDAWMNRSAESEWQDNSAWRIALRDYADALARLELHPAFITDDQLAHRMPPVSALILPHSIALSDQEIRTIAAFAANGGRVIADIPPGQFDLHGRPRAAPEIPVSIVAPSSLPSGLTLAPAFRVEPSNDVDAYLFRSRGHRLLALQRRAPGEKPEAITVELQGLHARDIATDRDYGRQQRLTLTLDPIAPSVLELTR